MPLFGFIKKGWGKIAAGAPSVRAHGQGAFNPAGNGLTSAEERRWNDPPVLAKHWQTASTGGAGEKGGNFVAYALERWGGRLPRSGLNALVIAGGDSARATAYAAALPALASVTLVKGAENADDPFGAGGRPEVPATVTDWEHVDRFGAFHLAISDGALSRRRDLDECLDCLTMSLAADGLLVVRDYVGPNHYQFDEARMNLVNGLLGLIPEDRRREAGGGVSSRREPPPLDWLLVHDPLSAIGSERLRAACREKFMPYEEIELGGTLLMPLLAGISRNFLDGSEEADKLLTALLDIENTLIKNRLLPSDHMLIIARNILHKSGATGPNAGFIDVEDVPVELTP